MKSNLFKYKIGLGVIGLLTLMIVIVVVVQASSAKKDADTFSRANSIATTLNEYVYSHSSIPKSLEAAGIKDVPATISYTRESDSSYKFCVNYKSASSGFDSTGTISNAVIQGMYGGALSGSSVYDTAPAGSLYIQSTHKKGENCQSVTSYLGSSSAAQYNNSSSVKLSSTEAKQAAIASGKLQGACSLSGYATHYAGKITAITTTDGKPVTADYGQAINLTITPEDGTATGTKTLALDDGSFVYGSDCYSLTFDNLQVGDYVAVFQDNSNQYYPVALIDYSQKY